MSHFSPEFEFTAPDELKLPQEYRDFMDSKGIPYKETADLREYLDSTDILYMTRIQQERFTDPASTASMPPCSRACGPT